MSQNAYAQHKSHSTPTEEARPKIGRTMAVHLTKNTLWAAIGILFLTIMALPYLNAKSTTRLKIAMQLSPSALTEKPVMIAPRLEGVDKKNQPYHVNAERAIQEGENLVQMEQVNGELLRQQGKWISVISKSGLLEEKKGLLNLSGDVNLFTEDGFQFQSESIAVNLKERSATSNTEVAVQSPTGVITARHFMFTDRDSTIRFKDNVRVRYVPASGKSSNK